MTADEKSNQSSLDPIDRISEILFGLIMVLTFTGSVSTSDAGKEDIDIMLTSAISCNLAWGIIDALMFFLASLTARGRSRILLRQISGGSTPEEGREIVEAALPPLFRGALTTKELEGVRARVLGLAEPPAHGRTLTAGNIISSLEVFSLVFAATFPVALPFLFMTDPSQALRVSNLIALALLFVLGYVLGRYAGERPYLWGVSMALIGSVVVSVTIALGG